MRPSAAAIEAVLRELLIGELGLDRERVAAVPATEPLLGRGIGIDSVEATALAAAAERRFGIVIPDEDLRAESFRDLRALAALIEGKLARSGRDGPAPEERR